MGQAAEAQATGFKGLSALVSDVSADLRAGSKAVAAGMASGWPKTVGTDHWATNFLEGRPPRDPSGPMEDLGAFLGAILRTRWGIFALIGGLIWTCEAVTSKPSRPSSYTPPATSRVATPTASSLAPPGVGSSNNFPTSSLPASTPGTSAPRLYLPPAEDLSEVKPPVGEGLSLIASQVRYCVFEKVRIAKMQPLIKNKTQVVTFNRFAEDYNQRCRRFLYTPGTLGTVQRQAAERNAVLAAEARQRL